MPELERWEEKAIKRVARFENSKSDVIINKLVDKAKSYATGKIKAGLKNLRARVDKWFAEPEVQTINGKAFREDVSVAQKVGMKIGAALTDTALEKSGDIAEAYIYRDFFYPSGKAVAKSAFNGQAKFDADLSRQMYNSCGYAPDFKAVLDEMYSTAAKVKPTLTDITWRKEVTPHMIRTAFQTELKKTFEAITKQHSENPTVFNRKFTEAHLTTAARQLSNIFEKFTLDLANNTEYLEAPMTFLPKKADLHPDIEMTKDERELLSKVSRHSLFEKEKDLQKQIAESVEKLPELPMIEALQMFKQELSKPLESGEAYVHGVNEVEDTKRLIKAVLNLRGMQERYESRGFFSRMFSKDARNERDTIGHMKNYLHEVTGYSADDLKTLLDPKTPLESNVSISEVLDIKPKGKTLSENVAELASNAGKALGNVTSKAFGAVVQVGQSIGSGAADLAAQAGEILGNTASTVSSGTMNVVYKTGEIIGSTASTIASGAVNVVYKTGEMVGNAASTLWSGFKTVASYANPFSYFGSNPAQPIEEVKEEPPIEEVQEEPVKEEEPKAVEQPDVKEEPKVVQPPKVEEVPEVIEPTVIEKLQQKQLELIRGLGTEPITNAPLFFGTMSKLVYLKTLEVSLANQTMSEQQAEEAMSEENLTAGAKKIKDETAFKKLKACVPQQIVKRLKTFGKEINENPDMVNDIHKEYVKNLHEFASPQKSNAQNEAPAKEPVASAPMQNM